MKKISFNKEIKREEDLQIRSMKDDLIAQIVAKTEENHGTKKFKLAKRIAIAYAIMKWTPTDLHALLGKANDPSIRNYTAFVKWSCTIRAYEEDNSQN